MFANEQFTEYAEAYMDMIFRVALNYLRSRADADDITQNILLKLYRSQKVFESDDHIKHWLIRVTINECKLALLSPWRKTEPIDEYTSSLSFETPEQSELFDSVMNLPTKYRIAILLHYYEDYSTEEIAFLLKIPRATVLTHLKRARDRLKTNLLEVKHHV
ncbi:MAG: sigma-70 family RNA polymerase sigma factor [Oscillospiraceae bacterium]|jgi:RNA polymerase sigma-70 factor (ECF subfamily)|nr:sigma-70 family RNA polymerase sigma factor [Oscillospiraceae bacterium]